MVFTNMTEMINGDFMMLLNDDASADNGNDDTVR